MQRLTALWRAVGACALAAALVPAAARAQPVETPTPAPPVIVDGPSSAIVGLSGMSIARDGTGGLAYLKTAGGVQHVFVSRLAGGVFQTPEQIDAGLGAASSQPVIAAGDDGVLLVGFINGGVLYVVDRRSASASYTAPMQLASGASNPSIQMSDFGKAYLAFAAGGNVRAAYYNMGRWALESPSLNATPGDGAGTGAGAPSVATAGDGIATIAWGENGHIYSRRVWTTSPSIVFERADVDSLSGWSELSARDPQAAVGGNSSYVNVAFDETVASGSKQQSRVLVNRLRGSSYDGVNGADGLSTPGGEGADQPRVAMGEYGNGLVTAAGQTTHQLVAALLGQNGSFLQTSHVDSLPNSSAPDAVPATAGLSSLIVAWQQNLGVGGTDIRARSYTANAGFGPEVVLSPGLPGTPDAPAGLVADGDVRGDAAAAWVQQAGGATEIVTAQLFQAPSGSPPRKGFAYARTTQPLLAWSQAEPWGPVRYSVTIDGAQVATTTATSVTVPTPLAQGPHTWLVGAVNPAGLQSTGRPGVVFVDTIRPSVRVTVSSKRKAGVPIRLDLHYTDTPHGLSRADASGIRSVVIHWGDGSVSRLHTGAHRTAHSYRHPGRYRIKVTVSDRAGNKRVVTRAIAVSR